MITPQAESFPFDLGLNPFNPLSESVDSPVSNKAVCSLRLVHFSQTKMSSITIMGLPISRR